MEGKIGGIVVALLIAGGIVWFKYSNKGNAGDDVRATAVQLVESLPDYAEHASDYDYYLDMHHETAFDNHYRIGSRRSGSSFNEDGYWNDLFAAMIRSATADGRDEVAKSLADLHLELMRD